jgi:hypothetical protein
VGKKRGRFLFLVAAFAAIGLLQLGSCGSARAQEAAPATAQKADSPTPKTGNYNAADSSANAIQDETPKEGPHKFWDKENDWLFAGVAAARTLDYFSTLNMRRRGRQEILLTNDVVDNHAAFAAIEAAGTGVSIGASYLFHHYEHHKLERWTSIVHIGLTTTGAVRNYCLKTAHFVSAPNSP